MNKIIKVLLFLFILAGILLLSAHINKRLAKRQQLEQRKPFIVEPFIVKGTAEPIDPELEYAVWRKEINEIYRTNQVYKTNIVEIQRFVDCAKVSVEIKLLPLKQRELFRSPKAISIGL